MENNSIHCIDIGVNLMHRQFDRDREQVLESAAAQGVSPLIITGTSVPDSERAAFYAGKHPGKLYCTAGIHPHDAKTCDDTTLEKLAYLALKPQVVAIGECGLDFDRDFSPRDVQRRWFKKQIKLAEELKMPLFLHERAAFREFAEIMEKHPGISNRSVVHCFTGTEAELKAYLDLGLSIGITGWICDERRGTHLRTIIRQIPRKRLMIETDAPFLLPRNMKHKPEDRRNEPAFLSHIAADIAQCLGTTAEDVAAFTSENAKRFFHL